MTNWLQGNAAFRLALALLLLLPEGLPAQKFYDDDPLVKMPAPRNVDKVAERKIAEYYDFFENTFRKPGERHSKDEPREAREINTLGEVPDSAWYTNRHYKSRMSMAELVRGPGNEDAPEKEGAWTIIAAKEEGITPGFTIEDVKGRKYLLKFDPKTNPEMASAADVITSKFLYALGYNVPENYIVYFDEEQLVIGQGVNIKDGDGNPRPMTARDVEKLLRKVPRDAERGYRALASRLIEGKILGPFRYYGTRGDDPNDIVPHEHRRDLRGLFVFSAWLGHHDAKSLNTLDTLVKEDGIQFVKHYLIDFGSSLGSASSEAKGPRAGNEYLFAWKPTAVQIFTLGLYVPRWARAHYRELPSVGRFESNIFEPEKWKPNYPNPAFDNRLPSDSFWAAKQVLAFTDDEIRAIVATGQYSDPEAERWVADTLIARRNKVAKEYFGRVLPLDQFAVKDGRLVFEDLAVKYDIQPTRAYAVRWFWFNNDTEEKSPLSDTTLALPRQLLEGSSGNYFAADIQAGDTPHTTTVYLRKRPDRVEIVGIERPWQGTKSG